jgi:hypothetical protein
MRDYVGEALKSQGWSDQSINNVLASSAFNNLTPDQLNAQEDQKQSQSSAVGGYYQGALSKLPTPAAGDVKGWRQWVGQFAPVDLKDDPQFLDTVLAGAHGESSLDPQKVQPDGNGRGLFQFDTSPGAMGEGLSQDQLFDPTYQAARIIPIYADMYRKAPQNLPPAERASWVAAMAEQPLDYTNPNSDARRNYVRSFNYVTSSNGTGQTTAGY